ncbi:MAG: M24 family metallopeptidase [Pseudobdellovibrionaceae bacterium]
MSDHHQLGVYVPNQKQIEGVDPSFIKKGLFLAREKTIQVTEEIKLALKQGMNESDARQLSLSVFEKHGVKKHWHKPWVRFGEGTTLSFYDPISESLLQANDIYHFDFGPVWPSEVLGLEGPLEYEGDYGNTFVFGSNEEAEHMIKSLHESFYEVKTHWKRENVSGEDLYKLFKKSIETKGYIFVDKVDGHRIGDFPHHKYTKDRLSKISFVPTSGLWVLEAMICHPQKKMGAFFEDIMD